MSRTSPWINRLGCALLALMAACGALYAARFTLLPGMFHWIDVGQRPCQADCIVVLSGDENSRPFVAAALWKAGFARRVFLTHPASPTRSGDEIYPATEEISRKVLLARGVEEGDIGVLGKDAATTFDEAEALREYLARSPMQRVLLVTNDYHTRRSRWIFQRVLADAKTELVVISAPSGSFTAENWWQSSLGFRLVLSEYGKLAFYAVRYGGWKYLIAGACAAALAWVAWRRIRLPQPLATAL